MKIIDDRILDFPDEFETDRQRFIFGELADLRETLNKLFEEKK